MRLTTAGDEAGDTLAVLKNVYQAFSTLRTSDHLSEDVAACVASGRQGDNPANEVLKTAWKSLRSLANRNVGPKIGNIKVSQEDLLSQIYAHGLWNPAPEHCDIHIPGESFGPLRSQEDASLEGQRSLRRRFFQ